MRRQREAQVSVETRFLVVGTPALKALPAEFREKAVAAETRPQPLTDAQANQLLRAVKQDEPSQGLTVPTLSLFDQQQAYVSVVADGGHAGFADFANNPRHTAAAHDEKESGFVLILHAAADATCAVEMRCDIRQPGGEKEDDVAFHATFARLLHHAAGAGLLAYSQPLGEDAGHYLLVFAKITPTGTAELAPALPATRPTGE